MPDWDLKPTEGDACEQVAEPDMTAAQVLAAEAPRLNQCARCGANLSHAEWGETCIVCRGAAG